MRRWIYPVLLVLVGTVSFSWYLVQFPLEREEYGFPLDDGWIHATYARNLANGHEFAFNPGEPSTGTTSVLWTILLAMLFRIVGTVLPASLLLGAASFLYFILSLYFFSRDVFRSRESAFFVSLLTLLSGFVLWWSLSGMETILFMALAISALNAYTRRRYTAAAVLVALTTLTRPEGVALAIIFIVHRFISERSGSHRAPGSRLRFAFLSLSGAGVYALWNMLVTGHLVTSTLAGRRWLASAPISYPLDPLYYLEKSWMLLVRWLRLFAFSYVPQELPGTIAAGILAGLVLMAGIGFMLRRIPRRKPVAIVLFATGVLCVASLLIPERSVDQWITENRHRSDGGTAQALIQTFESSGSGLSGKRIQIIFSFLGGLMFSTGLSIRLSPRAPRAEESRAMSRSVPIRLFLLWLIIHNVLYIVVIPYPGHGGRYQSINLILLILLFGEGFRQLYSTSLRGARWRQVRLAFLLLCTLSTVWIGCYATPRWRAIYFSTVRHINTIHRQGAEWIARYTPEQARVAAFDIGALGYFSGRYVIDLGGLIRPDPVTFMASGDIDSYILRSGATHLAMMYMFEEGKEQSTIARMLGVGRSGKYESIPMYIARFDSLEWRRNVSVAGNAYPILEISEIVPFQSLR